MMGGSIETMVPLLNMRAEVRNTGDTGNFTEMAVPHLCTLMGQKNGTRTASSTVKTDRLLNGLTDQKNGTRTVNITEYWLYGKRHREDGPAVEWENGVKEWWVDGR